MTDNPAIASMTFEQAMKELETIVRKLESSSSDLESAIADYTRGTQLKEHCAKKLSEARLKVEIIMKQQDGGIATRPFENTAG